MTPRKHFTTPKGTELPLLNLKGKEYLQVQHRLVWMREEHPDWSISTSFISVSDREAMARAEIRDASGRILATAHKTETASGFADFTEKAETGSVGRALAFVGYGTQFCADELDEGERIVDSPVPPKGKPSVNKITLLSNMPSGAPEEMPEFPSNRKPEAYDPGKYVVKFGKKFKGMKLEDCDIYELNSFHNWLKEQSTGQKGLSDDAHQAMVNIGQFLDSRERPAHLQEGK